MSEISETKAQRLIDEYEALRLRLKGATKNKYEGMRWGKTTLLLCLDGIEALAS